MPTPMTTGPEPGPSGFTPHVSKDDLAPPVRWRTGRHVGRTIYLQPGTEADRAADVLIGVMDTPHLARLVCEAVNAHHRNVADDL